MTVVVAIVKETEGLVDKIAASHGLPIVPRPAGPAEPKGGA